MINVERMARVATGVLRSQRVQVAVDLGRDAFVLWIGLVAIGTARATVACEEVATGSDDLGVLLLDRKQSAVGVFDDEVDFAIGRTCALGAGPVNVVVDAVLVAQPVVQSCKRPGLGGVKPVGAGG